MRIKKLLAVLLCFVMVLGCIPAAFAAEEATGAVIEVVADKAKPSAGDIVTYTVWLRNASATEGIGAFNFTVNLPEGLTFEAVYDEDEEEDVTYKIDKAVTAGKKMGMSTATVDEYETSMVFNAYGSEGYTGADLAVMTFYVVVNDGANGDLIVTLSNAGLFGALGNELAAPETVDCTISVCNHVVGEDWAYDATNHWNVCGCGQEKGNVAAHTYGEPVVTTPATCTTAGTQVLTCTVCGYEKTETIAAGHTFDIEHAQIDPTCVATGIVARHECSVCGVYDIADDAAVIDMVKHTYKVSEDNDEMTKYICEVCGAEYVEEKSTNTEIDSRPDGSVVITTTNEDGTVTTEIRKDGVTVTTTTGEDGTVLNTEVEIALGVDTTEVVELPVDAIVADSETTITIKTNSDEEIAVEIPVEEVTAGTVVVIVNEDGTEEVVATTKMTENGLVFDCPDGATIKVVDNAKSFADVAGDNWYNDAVDYVSARGIMSGMEEGIFSAETATTRAQFWTMLARLAGVDTTAAEGEAWYAVAQAWAIENGISDGTDANGEITREQLVTMLYRFVGGEGESASIEGFSDADDVSAWAQAAMEWAYGEGVMNGNADGTINPNGATVRSQIAQFFMNFIQSL